MTPDEDPMYRDTAASREAAETPVKLPEENKATESTGEKQAAINQDDDPSA